MQKCPCCGRKIGNPPPGAEFTMPLHDNYTKTAQCPASGKRFVNAGGIHSAAPARRRMPGELAAISLALAYLGNTPVHPAYYSRPRRSGR